MICPVGLQRLAKRAGSALAIAIGMAVATPANAQTIDSAYIELDLALCDIAEGNSQATTWSCPGYAGFSVQVIERQGRFSVGFGSDAASAKDLTHSFIPAADRLGPRIEWRLVRRDGLWHPFATILRWHFDKDNGQRPGQLLVVTGIEPGNTCHVAYVDVELVPNANEVARQQADSLVFDFECGHEDPYSVPS